MSFAWMRRAGASIAVVALALAVTASARADREEDDDDDFRQNVMLCEEAVERLAACCPGFAPKRISCRYYHFHSGGGCESDIREETVLPALSESESLCVRDATCGELRARDVCGRAQEAIEYVEIRVPSPDGGKTQSHAPVCP